VYTRITAKLAAQLAAGLAAANITNIIEVVDCAGALRAIFAVLIVWFKIFLAFNYLAYALI